MPLAHPLPTSDTPVQALYGAHHGWLLGWLRKKLNNQPQAADLAHDTFTRLLGAPTPSHPGALALAAPMQVLAAVPDAAKPVAKARRIVSVGSGGRYKRG